MKNFARYTGMGLIALLGAIACSDKSANEYKLVRRITTIENLALAKGYDVQIWYTEDGKFVENPKENQFLSSRMLYRVRIDGE